MPTRSTLSMLPGFALQVFQRQETELRVRSCGRHWRLEIRTPVITLTFLHAEDPLTDNKHDLRDEDPKIPLDSDTALGNKKLMTSRDVFRQSLPVVAQL